MSGATMRPVYWRTSHLRQVAMPSVACPRVHQVGTDGYTTDWLSCIHCQSCALCAHIDIDLKKQTGEVECGAIENGEL